jgi:serine/threonine protein kinase/WD40 repeat protein
MSDSSSAPDTRERVFERFYAELEDAADKQSVARKWAELYPQWADDFHQEAAFQEHLGRSQSGGEGVIKLPDFRIIGEIARGGMGIVYEAEQLSLKRRVAVKVRRGRPVPHARDRFLIEQEVLAQLHQTHIVPIHTAGQEGPWQYFAMAYIEGAALHRVVRATLQHTTSRQGAKTPTLAELAGEVLMEDEERQQNETTGTRRPNTMDDPNRVRRSEDAAGKRQAPGREQTSASPPVTLSMDYFRSVARVMAEAADALQHAHGAKLVDGTVGILHRDVKPSNIMVDTTGQCWLIDFGLARLLHAREEDGPPQTDASKTVQESLTQGPVGTPNYMAPEQYEERADIRTDVWGLGVTLYELLTLRRAFEASLPHNLQAGITSEDPVAPRKRVSNVPADLSAICMKCLQKNPAKRYTQAGQLAADLRRWLNDESTIARPAWPGRRVWLWARRNKGWAAATAISLVSLALFATLTVLSAEARAKKALRESLLQRSITLRLNTHVAGWSDDGWGMIREAAKIGKDEAVRDQAAAMLIGIDARIVKSLKRHASGVVFDNDGKRLLLGGTVDNHSKPQQAAVLWDSTTDQYYSSELPGHGPIAFVEGAPFQLVPENARTLILWDVVKRRAVQKFQIAAEGEPEELNSENYPTMCLAEDRKLVAASMQTREEEWKLTVWDGVSGKVTHQLPLRATALQLAPDGSWLAAGTEDGSVKLLSLPAGNQIAQFRQGRAEVLSFAYHRDYLRRDPQRGIENKRLAGLLAVCDAGGSVIVWELDTGLQRCICRGSSYHVTNVAFSPDGATLASAGRYNARLWDVATGRLLLTLPGANFVAGLAFSPDGRQLAMNNNEYNPSNSRVDIWQLETGRGMQSLRGLAGQVSRAVFSPRGDLLAGFTMDWQIGIWQVSTGRLLHVLEAPQGFMADNVGLAFSADNQQFACCANREAKLWDIASGWQVRSWTLPHGLCDTLAFTDRGQLLLIRCEPKDMKALLNQPADADRHSRVCRVRDLFARNPSEPILEILDFNRHVHAILAPTDGRFFIVEGRTGTGRGKHSMKAFDSQTGKEIWSLPASDSFHDSLSSDWSLDPSGRRFLVGSATDDNRPFNLLELPTGRLIASWQQAASGLGPDGRHYVRKLDHGLALYRGGSTTALLNLGIDSRSSSFQFPPFNPAGTHVAWGNDDGTVSLCDINEVQTRLAELGLGW